MDSGKEKIAKHRATEFFGLPVNFEQSTNGINLEDCLEWEDALDLITSVGGQIGRWGKQTILAFALRSIRTQLRFESFGRLGLARDQLLAGVLSGKVRLFGVCRISGEDVWRPNSEMLDAVYQILPDKIDDVEAFEVGGVPTIAGVEFDVLLVPMRDLELFDFEAANEAHDTGAERTLLEAGSSRRFGRPPKWDWEWIMLRIAAEANTPDGLPDKQADLERWVLNLCQERWGSEPSESQVRKHVGPLYQVLRSKGSKAGSE